MTTVTTKKLLADYLPFSNVPYGNALVASAVLATTAAGALVNGDTTGALATGDIARIGVLPAGMRINDALMIVSDAFTATQTAKVGFQYVDGVDDATVPQDDDYFAAALSLAAAGRTRANNTAVVPVTLPKDAYLIVTIGVADTAAAGRLDVVVQGDMVGAL